MNKNKTAKTARNLTVGDVFTHMATRHTVLVAPTPVEMTLPTSKPRVQVVTDRGTLVIPSHVALILV